MKRAPDSVSTPVDEALFRTRKFFRDGGEHARVHRLDVGGKNRGDMAVTADEVFVEIPPRRLERALAGRPLVERMRAWSLDLNLRRERKSNAVIAMMSAAPPGSWPPKSFEGTPTIINPRP